MMGVRGTQYPNSPLLRQDVPVERSRVLVFFLALGFLGLTGRAAYLQIFNHDFYVKKGEGRYARTPELPAKRGQILDRHGNILASSVPAPSIWAEPDDFNANPKQLRALSELVEIPEAQLKHKLKGKNFVWIKRQLDEPIAEKIMALGIKGLYSRKEYRRQYPDAEALAHIVGITNADNVGKMGVESQFNTILSGRAGSRRVIKDRMGRVIEDSDIVDAQDGETRVLSVDSKLQFIAYQKLRDAVQLHRAKSGSLVLLDAQTGEILALTNYPSFNPNKRHSYDHSAMHNSAVEDMYEPGSSMKPFTVALALQQGLVSASTKIDTQPGVISITGFPIKDEHPIGVATVKQIIQHSSNVGTVKIAEKLDKREMWNFLSSVGFGQKPSVSLPSNTLSSGRLRSHKNWRPIDKATISYGYGVAASLLQMAQAYTIFAHDGRFIPASLERLDAPANSPVLGERVLSADKAKSVRDMLHSVVHESGGTGSRAAINGYSVGGKTGTVHKLVNNNYAQSRYSSFFVGLAPIAHPRVIAAVMIDDPSNGQYFGGTVAAPVFSQVVEYALQRLEVRPDLPLRTAQTVTDLSPQTGVGR